MKKIFFIILSLAFLTACERKIDEFSPTSNGVDFSKYVAVGNSLTAGYADGALYNGIKIGQDASYANILANQLKTVGLTGFTQPLIGTTDGVGFTMTQQGPYFTTKFTLQWLPSFDCSGNPIPGSETVKPYLLNPAANQATLAGILGTRPVDPGPYNNMGVPGARVVDLFTPGYGSSQGNPYFARFATSPMTPIIHDALVQQPTFFSLWIGNNDVLLSALDGTDTEITPSNIFEMAYRAAVDSLLNSGKSPKGVVATIPDVTSIPYFTTISSQLPYNGVYMDSAQAALTNYVYFASGHSNIVWKAGYNPFVITNSAGDLVQMGPEDLFLLTLPTSKLKCNLMGVVDTTVHPLPVPYPIPGKYVLQKSEIDNLQASVNAFNTIIKNVANEKNLALVDMNETLKDFASGITYDGNTFNLNFVTGGMFSTDGIHLCPRANAVTANYFIQAINSKYGCNIPQVDINEYPGLVFPNTH